MQECLENDWKANEEFMALFTSELSYGHTDME